VAVYSAVAIMGLVVGLLVGGLLVTYLSWRWVFFVNVPIGLVVAALATRVLPTSARRWSSGPAWAWCSCRCPWSS
jgi:MFS family permease